MFDEAWYLERYPDVAALKMDPIKHFLWIGAKIGRSPSIDFDTNSYLVEYDDVTQAGVNPLLHYLKWGKSEGRTAFAIERHCNEATSVASDKGRSVAGAFEQKNDCPLVVYESHNLKMQGAPNSLFEIAVGVSRRGRFQVAVSSNTSGPLLSLYEENGISKLIHSISQNKMKDDRKRDEWIARLSHHYRDLGAGIVHVNTLQNFHAVIAAKKAGCSVVWNIRESEDPETYYDYLPEPARAMAYSAFGKADICVFVAHATRKLWQNFLGEHLNAATVHNGINMDRLMTPVYGTNRALLRAKYQVEKADTVILSVGTVCERKGQIDLLRAIELFEPAQLARTIVAVVGFNDTTYSKDVRRGFEDLRQHGIRLIAVDETQTEEQRRILSELYLCADVFAFCSRMESYPRVIMEALEFGLPIVSTPCFGVVEQLVEGSSGLFYSQGDVQVLAERLLQLCGNFDMRRSMSRAARKRLQELNSYERMIEAYESIYADLL
ncbi:glycosyltransferase family 4 protein (plasmid) [Sinorhizobium chiapasense]|uniref:glycosyltransferase family 4 protein n=1 Tax=Sinorhizobium chiapasense TaxID=501572 RepID=UPI002FE09D27